MPHVNGIRGEAAQSNLLIFENQEVYSSLETSSPRTSGAALTCSSSPREQASNTLLLNCPSTAFRQQPSSFLLRFEAGTDTFLYLVAREQAAPF
jgi:hypothetical protein